MIKLTVMYPNSEDLKFDMDYYRSTHIPMMQRLIAERLKGFSLDRAAGADLPAPYAVMANLLFESVKSMQAALAALEPGAGKPPPASVSFGELQQIVGFPDYWQRETQYKAQE